MIAGKYAQLMANPAASMALGGGIAAGASLLGNQGEDKSTGRQALEALGAGTLGAGVGAMLPSVYAKSKAASKMAAQDARDMAQNRAVPLDRGERMKAEARVGEAARMRTEGKTDQEIREALDASILVPQTLTNAAAAAGGLGLATGLGGLVGGGVANIGNMAGLGIDPESPGSSNTTNSRMSMQGGSYMQSMAEDIGAMRERSDRREQERNLQNIGTAAIGVGALGALGLSARNRLR